MIWKNPIQKYMKNVASNYYMMKKIHQKSSLHQLTKNKMRFGHVSRALKSVVWGKNRLGQFDIPCPSSCQVPKWWDIRVLGLVRLILKLLKKQETRNKSMISWNYLMIIMNVCTPIKLNYSDQNISILSFMTNQLNVPMQKPRQKRLPWISTWSWLHRMNDLILLS